MEGPNITRGFVGALYQWQADETAVRDACRPRCFWQIAEADRSSIKITSLMDGVRDTTPGLLRRLAGLSHSRSS